MLTLIILLVMNYNSFAQEVERTFNPLSGSFGIMIDGGVALPLTDFKNEISFPVIRGGLEYFFPTSSPHAFGLRAMVGYNHLQGKRPDNKPHYPIDFKNNITDAKFGLVYAAGTGNVIPYLSGGLNYPISYSDYNPEKKLAWFGELGFKIFVADNLTLNLSGTLNATGVNDVDGRKRIPPDVRPTTDLDDYYGTAQLGLALLVGAQRDSDGDGVYDDEDMCPNTPIGVKVDEFGCPLDGDKDGVPDYLDRCPDTPTGVQVDAEGCPVDSDNDGVADYLDKCPNTPKNIKVDRNGCPVDTDGDGVADYLDKCPDTPKDVKVDEEGCPVDSDGDGVPDYLDKCADTPKGTKVDNHGCPEVTEPFKVTVYFGFDKSNLTKEATAELNGAISFMKQNPEAMFALEGHTCWIGPESYNMKLSEKRASSVFEYLAKEGIDKQRLQKKWFGETMPSADNKTKEGRKLNRRTVVIQIMEK
jgi:OOP family OmpA-OmpF porin